MKNTLDFLIDDFYCKGCLCYRKVNMISVRKFGFKTRVMLQNFIGQYLKKYEERKLTNREP